MKSLLYDWGDRTVALLLWLQPDAVSVAVLAWLVSALDSYWGFPVVLDAMARSSRWALLRWWRSRWQNPQRGRHLCSEPLGGNA